MEIWGFVPGRRPGSSVATLLTLKVFTSVYALFNSCIRSSSPARPIAWPQPCPRPIFPAHSPCSLGQFLQKTQRKVHQNQPLDLPPLRTTPTLPPRPQLTLRKILS